MSEHVEAREVYTEEVGALYDEAAVSCGPASRDLLIDKAVEYGVSADSLVLDVGCANGGVSRKLLARTGCRIAGVEMLPLLVNMGIEQNRELGVDGRFHISEGSILELPFADDTFDFVFCVDVVGMVGDLDRAFAECWRVLKPGGRMLVYASFATERLSQREAQELHMSLGGDDVPESMSLSRVETPLLNQFRLIEKTVIGSQFTQYDVEQSLAGADAAQNLLKVARLLTWPEKYIAEFGERRYRIVLAETQWAVFILLGKLEPTFFVVEKPFG